MFAVIAPHQRETNKDFFEPGLRLELKCEQPRNEMRIEKESGLIAGHFSGSSVSGVSTQREELLKEKENSVFMGFPSGSSLNFFRGIAIEKCRNLKPALCGH